MKNIILHYMHYNHKWFYWFDESSQRKYWRKYNSKDITWLPEIIYTKRECREYLKEKFPEYTIMIAYAYHFSPSSGGSRPTKCTIDRKLMLKEKIKFKSELYKIDRTNDQKKKNMKEKMG